MSKEETGRKPMSSSQHYMSEFRLSNKLKLHACSVRNNADGAMNPYDQYESPRNTRRHQRYELETELTANVRGVERRQVMRGRSLNINEGGIGGLFTSGWEVGTSVDLQFSVPITTTPVRVRAVVRNRTSYRHGFEFVNLTPEQRDTISRTCRTLGLLQ